MNKHLFINSMDVPKPLHINDEESIMGKSTWHVKFTNKAMVVCNSPYKGTPKQRWALTNGMMHFSKENAVRHAHVIRAVSTGVYPYE